MNIMHNMTHQHQKPSSNKTLWATFVLKSSLSPITGLEIFFVLGDFFFLFSSCKVEEIDSRMKFKLVLLAMQNNSLWGKYL